MSQNATFCQGNYRINIRVITSRYARPTSRSDPIHRSEEEVGRLVARGRRRRFLQIVIRQAVVAIFLVAAIGVSAVFGVAWRPVIVALVGLGVGGMLLIALRPKAGQLDIARALDDHLCTSELLATAIATDERADYPFREMILGAAQAKAMTISDRDLAATFPLPWRLLAAAAVCLALASTASFWLARGSSGAETLPTLAAGAETSARTGDPADADGPQFAEADRGRGAPSSRQDSSSAERVGMDARAGSMEGRAAAAREAAGQASRAGQAITLPRPPDAERTPSAAGQSSGLGDGGEASETRAGEPHRSAGSLAGVSESALPGATAIDGLATNRATGGLGAAVPARSRDLVRAYFDRGSPRRSPVEPPERP